MIAETQHQYEYGYPTNGVVELLRCRLSCEQWSMLHLRVLACMDAFLSLGGAREVMDIREGSVERCMVLGVGALSGGQQLVRHCAG